MKWNEITHEHTGRRVRVSDKSTPESPILGAGPYFGRVLCANRPDAMPVLLTDTEIRSFAWYWDVEPLD